MWDPIITRITRDRDGKIVPETQTPKDSADHNNGDLSWYTPLELQKKLQATSDAIRATMKAEGRIEE